MSGLTLGVSVNLAVVSSFEKLILLWRVSSGCCLFLW